MTEPEIKITTMFFKGEKCYGPGIHALLLGVQEHHTLRGAAMAMHMAYSKAWRIVKECEQGLGFALIYSTVGGKHGGGAVLTREGEAMVKAYAQCCEKLNAYAKTLVPQLFADLLRQDPASKPGEIDHTKKPE